MQPHVGSEMVTKYTVTFVVNVDEYILLIYATIASKHDFSIS